MDRNSRYGMYKVGQVQSNRPNRLNFQARIPKNGPTTMSIAKPKTSPQSHFSNSNPPLLPLVKTRNRFYSHNLHFHQSPPPSVMGGRGRRTQRKHFREGRENVWKRPKSSNDSADVTTTGDANNQTTHTPWEPFATQNPAFDEYYKEQGIVSSDEWDTFMEYLRKPLPSAFRINSSGQFYADLRSQLENDFMKSLQAEDDNGVEIDAINPLPWYPDNLAWQSNFSRNQLRKNLILGRFHEFLKLENEIGNITRQEAVSMVPPLFLDVRPEHFVLDMCAAPGSKTFQLLEMIHNLTEPGTLPSGMVIANDLDVQRCNLLIHQTKRMCTSNLIVTNHEAQHFPSCHLRRKGSDSDNGNVKEPVCINQLQFDRVLCDVPCSGDGTLRKAPDIWRKWNIGNGNGLHGLQVQIAMRGLALVKVGGRMVYSTCSMNPLENEAVVAEVLRRCGGTVELLDLSNELPQLPRRPGLKKWKVRDKGQWFASYKDVPKYRRAALTPGMFPSGKSYDEITEPDPETVHFPIVNEKSENVEDQVALTKILEAEVSDLPLERCMRIVPHDNNSGAFFIAVLHKHSALPAAEKKQASDTTKMDSGTNQPEIPMNEVTEGSNGHGADLITEMDGQISEATPVVDILDDAMEEEASLDTDQNKDSEEIEKGKTEPTPDAKTGEPAPDVKTGAGKRKLQIQGKWRGVDPVIFYKDDAAVSSIIEFYGIKESFPFKGRLITRHDDMNHVKRIYYVSDSVKRVLELNLLAGQQLKIASVGLKMFERQSSKEGSSTPCVFRISSEGLPLILPHVTKQILYASAVDFKHLLQYKSIKFKDFVNPGFEEKATNLMLGCCVVVLNKENGAPSDSLQADDSPIAIGCWRGKNSISVMVTALDCKELLERLSMLKSAEGSSPIPETDMGSVANESEIKPDN